MRLNARVQTDQVKLTLIMKYGHHMMEDMEKISASWDNKFHTLEESKNQNASTVRNSKERYLDSIAHALKLITNVMLAITELLKALAPNLLTKRRSQKEHLMMTKWLCVTLSVTTQ